MDVTKSNQPARNRSIAHAELRRRTRPDHEAVDQAFARYNLVEVDDYRAFLCAHARVLPELEAELAPAKLIEGWVGRTKALSSDLEALEMSVPLAVPVHLPVTDGARWGAVYVLEGSRLGGALLAKQVARDFPVAYLSAIHAPGGWQRILGAIEKAAEGPTWIDQAVEGAKLVFAAYERAAAEDWRSS